MIKTVKILEFASGTGRWRDARATVVREHQVKRVGWTDEQRVTEWCDKGDREIAHSWFDWLKKTGVPCALVEVAGHGLAVYREPLR